MSESRRLVGQRGVTSTVVTSSPVVRQSPSDIGDEVPPEAIDSAAALAAVPLLEPVGGIPPVTATPMALTDVMRRMREGTGPIAIDAERASGYRYSQRAYLVQMRRTGAGTAIIDPIALPDLSQLGDELHEYEWVLHAASQDLPCLSEVGIVPEKIFDTELAGRLAGFERVGLGAMVERVLGYGLEKGHSAADWSTRPLPEPWLRYAALDVELLIDLRDALEAELDNQGKLDWAHEEFAAVLATPPREPRAEPWRRTSGIHRVRNRRHLAAVRELWQSRDELARARDIAPGRVLPDSAIIAAVLAQPADIEALRKLPVFSGPRQRRLAARWWDALSTAARLPDSTLPAAAASNGESVPPPNRWAERDVAAANRLARVRAVLNETATAHHMPVENLLEPALSRRLAWSPPADLHVETVTAALRAGGARGWQISLVSDQLTDALRDQSS
jgi:ribonuclease D